MIAKQKNLLTDEDRSFILENYSSVPVSEMAIKLKKKVDWCMILFMQMI